MCADKLVMEKIEREKGQVSASPIDARLDAIGGKLEGKSK